MSKYNEPFCIIGSVGRFAPCYEARKYLPPIEPEAYSDKDWAEHDRRYQEFGLKAYKDVAQPHLQEKVYQEAKYPKQKSYCGIRQ